MSQTCRRSWNKVQTGCVSVQTLHVCGLVVADSPHLLFFSPLQACGDPKAKPSYLVDKNLESAVKFIVRKFPAVETRNNNVSVREHVCRVASCCLCMAYGTTTFNLFLPQASENQCWHTLHPVDVFEMLIKTDFAHYHIV